MKPLLIANWKMNFTELEVTRFLERFLELIGDQPRATILVSPSFPSLRTAVTTLRKTGVGVVAQDLFPEEQGAFTGAVSAAMLAAVGCSHVLVGHSERRKFWGEDDALIRRKLIAALKHGLRPVLCIGETAVQRREGQTRGVVVGQLRQILDGVALGEDAGLTIAYEPVWAIGTGDSASPEQAQEVHAWIRTCLEEIVSAPPAETIPILYGGSVTAQTAGTLLAQPTIEGLLVGSASLEPGSFAAICASIPGAP